MALKLTLANLISFALILICILLLVFRKEPKQIYPVAPVKVIETRIENKEKDILGLMNQIAVDRQVIHHIGRQLKDIKGQLATAKAQKDTVNIIQLQDIVITKQDTTIFQYVKMDRKKDSVIAGQRYIINSKDTLLTVKDHQIKRVKRQRNISLLINGVLTGLLILK